MILNRSGLRTISLFFNDVLIAAFLGFFQETGIIFAVDSRQQGEKRDRSYRENGDDSNNDQDVGQDTHTPTLADVTDLRSKMIYNLSYNGALH